MKLVPCENINVVRSVIRSDNQAIIQEFAESEHDCVEVVGYHHKHAYICQRTLSEAIKRLRMRNSIGVSVRGKHVYLYKKHYD